MGEIMILWRKVAMCRGRSLQSLLIFCALAYRVFRSFLRFGSGDRFLFMITPKYLYELQIGMPCKNVPVRNF